MIENEIPSLAEQVRSQVSAAVRRLYPEAAEVDPAVHPSEAADFQSEVAMILRSQGFGSDATEVAFDIAEVLRSAAPALIARVRASGGVLNITVTDTALWNQVARRVADPRLGLGTPLVGRRVVVDYSGPNVGKELHVGHLRGTNIGDALARIKGFLGAEVTGLNHLGDWGIPVAMLIEHLVEPPETTWQGDGLDGAAPARTLDARYQAALRAYNVDSSFAARVHKRVVAMQSGDSATMEQWHAIVDESVGTFQRVYDRLGVLLKPDDIRGESFYNPWLADVVDELLDARIAVWSEGAVVVKSSTLKGPEDEPTVLVIRKSDGGFDYATTELAALRHRIQDLGADQILYLIDSRQKTHMEIVCEAAQRAGWLDDRVEVVPVTFGIVRSPDGKPIRTRDGVTVKLMDLLDDAAAVARERHETDAETAEALGIGAVKYADLSAKRHKDYMFNLERMVSMHASSIAYVQYAHVRVGSILREAGDLDDTVRPGSRLTSDERALALRLDAFGKAVADADEDLEPYHVVNYLYELAKIYHKRFYKNCPVIAADDDAQRANRLALCELTARTVRQGLELFGVAALERM